ncbi:glycosyltransferase family 2 protein [Candidatus Leptofilum sp.]|uniref:glycosyltransferase family 2 protein n=1 Tax=Candidatus Leptofilum sp. TaxID=3241576 RepID=UPI003B59F6EC
MSLAILILNWNRAEDSIHCVRSVQAWCQSVDTIWVIDNNSAPADRAKLQEALKDEVTFIFSIKNLGFAGGNNLGLQAALAAEHDTILLLNNDATVAGTAVSKLLSQLKSNPQLGMVGPELWDGDQLLSAGGSDIGLALGTHHQKPLADGELREVAYVPGTCILIRTAVLQKIGLLDEAYFFGGEVADLCARARQAGFRAAVLGGTRAQHQVERSAGQRHQLHIYYVLRNRFLYVQKFHAGQRLRLFLYWSLTSGRIWLEALLHRNWPRARAAALACWDGWNGRFGGQNARVTRGKIL